MMELRGVAWKYGVGILLVASVPSATAQKKDNKSGYDRSARATVLHQATVYVSADADAQHVSLVTPGHEVVVVERNGPWVRVFANTDIADKTDDSENPELVGEEDNVTPASGWIRNKGVVSPTTPGGDTILFGAAANLEDEAAQPHAPKDAAVQAHLLYRRVAEYYPDSPLAQEAAWRSADVRWQVEKRDVSSLPSAKEQEAYLRPQIYEGEMKKLMKQYPGTKYAAMAAFDLLDNKLCGDWQGLPKCPEMESGLYEKYAKQFPDGPRSAEALYDATYRQGVLVGMYLVDENKKKSEAAVERTKALADEVKAQYPKSDFAARAASVAFRVQQGIPIQGNDRD
jgi:outer membrane protein assembly factor BamD (BamD/ComL family)